ncbi:MAG: hypothetical protein OEY15_02140 [Myxococcales bacterium]|nr:hypothetical protein [Myxococcales bacterium]
MHRRSGFERWIVRACALAVLSALACRHGEPATPRPGALYAGPSNEIIELQGRSIPAVSSVDAAGLLPAGIIPRVGQRGLAG